MTASGTTTHVVVEPAVRSCASSAPTEAPLDRAAAEDLAKTLKAVADPTRLQLLSLIRAAPAGEACVCDLTEPVGLSQPTVSHHLKVLVNAGLLRREPRGTWTWYSLVAEQWEGLRNLLA
ncbi:ArsR/SmtB family transcription factor [Fodinicola feengrottensis]|uniref:Metalloregulator ArsR/SmtB family transcription factor n=1 Tax=Fodinicola feengrottensis TaxID=435914 RepID=A0ABN2J9D2_9ACTN|nr:metalloregulator ArsR/SmtB family transcription factor [Fodinicola feengrottensis]